jgi:hypothetical protein
LPATAAIILDEEKLALTDNEAERLAVPFLEILKEFMPAAGARYAAIISFTAGAIAVGAAKAPIAREALKRRADKKKAEAEAQALTKDQK